MQISRSEKTPKTLVSSRKETNDLLREQESQEGLTTDMQSEQNHKQTMDDD